MRLFHFWHRWCNGVKIGYAPPANGCKLSGHGIESYTLEKIAFGLTTYKQTCKVCGKERIYEVIGK